MERLDALIKGGKVVSPQGVRELDVGILNGKVHTLAAPDAQLDAARTIDAKAMFVLPGCVDAHVHTRDPGLTHKEDFATLSHGAAVGGVTTIMCQPTTSPPINSVETVMQVLEEWPKTSVVDFTIQAMAEPGNMGEIKGMLDAGAVSMEFLGQGSTGPMMMEVMKVVHENGGISSLSGGDGGYSQFMRQQLQEAGKKDMAAWISAWPAVNEAVGAARVLLLTEGTPYRFHFHMITTRRAVELLRQAKHSGREFSVETSPKYLLLTEEDHLRMGPFSTVIPRFKTRDDNEAIWEGILNGTIDMIDTDHAPHTREEKEAGYEDIWKAPTGVPEVELSLRLMLNEVNNGRLSISKLVDLMSETPAREYGIYPQKGALEVGSDADIVLVDMDREKVVEDAYLVTAPKYSAFGGRSLKGFPATVLLKGQVIAENGAVVEGSPRGNVVRPRR